MSEDNSKEEEEKVEEPEVSSETTAVKPKIKRIQMLKVLLKKLPRKRKKQLLIF